MTRKVLLAFVLCLVMAVSAFAAGQSDSSANGEDPFTQIDDPDMSGDVSWYLGGDDPFYYEIADAFMDQYPGISIDVMATPWGEWTTRFVTMAASGQMPDVVWFIAGQPGLPLNVANWHEDLLDLSPFMGEANALGFIDESLLEGAMIEDRLVGLPYEFNNIVLFYNKEMFDEAGLDYPDSSWTWEDLLENGKKLTKDDGTQYGLVWSEFETDIVMGGAGTTVFNEDGSDTNFDTPEAEVAFEFLKDMYLDVGIAPPPGVGGISLASRNAAMEVHGNWNFGTYRGAELDFGATLIPAGPAGHATLQRMNVWSVNKNAEDLPAALTFAKFLGFGEGLERWAASGRLAPYEQFTVDSYLNATGVAGTAYEQTFVDLMNLVFENAAYAIEAPLLPAYVDGNAIDQIVQDQKYLLLVEESITVDEALATMEADFAEYLETAAD